jgi:hypothetical protein
MAEEQITVEQAKRALAEAEAKELQEAAQELEALLQRRGVILVPEIVLSEGSVKARITLARRKA